MQPLFLTSGPSLIVAFMEQLTKPMAFDALVPRPFAEHIEIDFRTAGCWSSGRYSHNDAEAIKAWGIVLCEDREGRLPGLYTAALYLFRLVEGELRKAGILRDPYAINRIHVDGRTDGQYGYVHQDRTESNMLSVLYYVNTKWPPGWGGPTLFFDNLELLGRKADAPVIERATRFDFTPGRFIAFPSSVAHASVPPTNECATLRMTLSYILELL